jgi:hypothetical protein
VRVLIVTIAADRGALVGIDTRELVTTPPARPLPARSVERTLAALRRDLRRLRSVTRA